MRILKSIGPLLIILSVLILPSCYRSEPVTFSDLLEEMISRKAITEFPDPAYQLKQFSSYDRGSVSPKDEGWYANEDYTRFLGVDSINKRREFVLFDHAGPGAIVRWWMTFAGEGSYDGLIRIYLDGSDKAFIEDSVLKVLSGHLLTGEPLSSSVSPESDYYRRGHNLYMPVPYSKSCRITYECDSIRLNGKRWTPSIYYNINYRAYKEGTEVVTLNNEQLANSKALLDRVNETLNSSSEIINPGIKLSERIEPGASLSKTIQKSGSAISALSVKLDAEDLGQALRSTVLEIIFDNTRTVWVPLGDFFATGFDLNESFTWYSSVNADTTLSCRWIMPFKDCAIARILNLGNQDVSTGLSIIVEDYSWDIKSMYFGAAWHEYNRIQTAGDSRVGGNDQHMDINYIDIIGKGVYAGDAITIYNTVDAWWGEGDEKIYVDNEDFPSSIGTGTEDYYGYAWCRPEPFSHPFIAQPTGEGNFHPGMTVNVRYRSLDAIPFNKKISSNIELWHWVPAIMNYAMTSYFYILPAYTINVEPDNEAVARKIPSGKSDLLE